ncbi:MAG: T9SS type A sorting domain-containing protein [Bacteroidota bacterium]|nr:MAG: T9SS type A sorting domain-containing protein [Bacteroidota bacterium]
MSKFSKISFIFLLLLSISAISLAAGNIYLALNDNGTEVNVYPNPVLGSEFTVQSNQGIDEIKIVNVLGQQVFASAYLNQKTVEVDLDISEKGLFIVQVKLSNGSVITKRVLLK